jgi:outer membrane protein assembly factor BamB
MRPRRRPSPRPLVAAATALLALGGAVSLVVASIVLPGLADPGARRPSPARVAPVWTADAAVLGEVVVVDGLVIGTVRAGVDLEYRAWSVDDGREVWSRARLAPLRETDALTPQIVERDGATWIVAVTVAERGAAWGLELLDAESGRPDSAVPLAGLPDETPSRCDWPDVVDEVCVVLDGTTLRIDPRDGSRVADDERLPPGARSLGDGFFDDGAGVGRADDDGVAWSRAKPALLGGGAGEDVEVQRIDEGLGLAVLSGRASGIGRKHADMAGERLVAVDLETGAPRWRSLGATTRCVSASVDPPVRCRLSGTARGDDVSDVRVVLEGFDLATGRTTWTRDVDDTPAAVWSDGGTVLVPGDGFRFVRIEGRVMRLDLATGDLEPVPRGAGLPCWDRVEASWDWNRVLDDARVLHYPSAVAAVCDVRGRIVDRERVTPAYVRAVGEPDGRDARDVERRLVVARDGLRAYDIPRLPEPTSTPEPKSTPEPTPTPEPTDAP